MYTGLRCNNLAQKGVPKSTNCDVGCLLLHVNVYSFRNCSCVYSTVPTYGAKGQYGGTDN